MGSSRDKDVCQRQEGVYTGTSGLRQDAVPLGASQYVFFGLLSVVYLKQIRRYPLAIEVLIEPFFSQAS